MNSSFHGLGNEGHTACKVHATKVSLQYSAGHGSLVFVNREKSKQAISIKEATDAANTWVHCMPDCQLTRAALCRASDGPGIISRCLLGLLTTAWKVKHSATDVAIMQGYLHHCLNYSCGSITSDSHKSRGHLRSLPELAACRASLPRAPDLLWCSLQQCTRMMKPSRHFRKLAHMAPNHCPCSGYLT